MAELPVSAKALMPARQATTARPRDEELGPLRPPERPPPIIDAKFKRVRRSDAEWEIFAQKARNWAAVGAAAIFAPPLTLAILHWLDPYLDAFNHAVGVLFGYR